MNKTSTNKAGGALKAMSFSFFGALWLVAWCLQTFGARPDILTFIVCTTAGIFLVALRQFQKAKKLPWKKVNNNAAWRLWRIFHAVNALQWVAILLAALFLSFAGYSEWIASSIILIVGLHFFPLARAFQSPDLYFTGSAMVMVSIVFPFITEAGPANPVGFLGAGIILWVSAIWALVTNSSAT